jgi:hypothetical protein
MAISLFLVFIVDVASEEDITGTFNVFARDILGIIDDQSDLIVKNWLGLDIIGFWCSLCLT